MDNKPEMKIQIVCELCDKVFPNRVQKSNYKLLVHTVREEEIKCEFCSEICVGLKEICKHISNTHSELFPKSVSVKMIVIFVIKSVLIRKMSPSIKMKSTALIVSMKS